MTARPKTVRRKHVPQRTCVACRETLPKRSLIRVVRSADGIVIDPTGKIAGRGAYLHNRRSCWERGLKGTLAQALRSELSKDTIDQLRAFAATLSDDTPEEQTQALEAPTPPASGSAAMTA